MRINFVTVSNHTMASYRYHNLIPANGLKKLGHEAQISAYPLFDMDVYIFSKHFNYGDYWYSRGVQTNGNATAFFHCCDNHFETEHKDHYMRMMESVDYISVSTEQMRNIILNNADMADRDIDVIPDAYELERIDPVYNAWGALNVLWFGHRSNLDELKKFMDGASLNINLTICSDTMSSDWADKHIPKMKKYVPYGTWSARCIIPELAKCDCVIIPSDPENPRKQVKSHNRLTESVISGKFVIASPLPSYLPYKDWMYIGDISKGLEWLAAQKEGDIKERITAAQEFAVKNYHPDIIAGLWERYLKDRVGHD